MNKSNQTSAKDRQYARKIFPSLKENERTAFLDTLIKKASPSIDFYLYGLISAILLGLGFFFDSPYLILFAAIVVPQVLPVIGIALGVVLGTRRVFFNNFASTLVMVVLVFAVNALSGLLSTFLLKTDGQMAHLFTQFSLPAFLVMGVCTIFFVSGFVNEKVTVVPAIGIGLTLLIPLGAAGFGFGRGDFTLFTNGMTLFGLQLSIGLMVSVFTLLFLGFRPESMFGYTVGGAIALFFIILVILVASSGAVVVGHATLPTMTPSPTATRTPLPTSTATPIPPTSTPTLTPTATIAPPTSTPTITPTPTNVPKLGLVVAGEDGVFIRNAPSGTVIAYLNDGDEVVVLPDAPVIENGYEWYKVEASNLSIEGWVVSDYIYVP